MRGVKKFIERKEKKNPKFYSRARDSNTSGQ